MYVYVYNLMNVKALLKCFLRKLVDTMCFHYNIVHCTTTNRVGLEHKRGNRPLRASYFKRKN